MTTFSATDAALEGLRITREQPRAFLLWVGFSLLVSVISALVMVSLGAETRAALQSINTDADAELGVLAAAMTAAAPILLLGLVVQCIMAAAIYRVVLRPDDHGVGYMKIGMDEVRLLFLTLLYIVLATVGVFVVVLAAGLVGALVATISRPAGMFVGSVAYIFAMGVLLYMAVRLSLAPTITFAERRLAVFDSWAVTRGSFWLLFGAYGLALACLVVVMVLALVIFTAVASLLVVATGGQLSDVGEVFSAEPNSLKAYLNPVMIAYLIFASIMQAVYYAIIVAPAAVAYRALREQTPEGASEAF